MITTFLYELVEPSDKPRMLLCPLTNWKPSDFQDTTSKEGVTPNIVAVDRDGSLKDRGCSRRMSVEERPRPRGTMSESSTLKAPCSSSSSSSSPSSPRNGCCNCQIGSSLTQPPSFILHRRVQNVAFRFLLPCPRPASVVLHDPMVADLTSTVQTCRRCDEGRVSCTSNQCGRMAAAAAEAMVMSSGCVAMHFVNALSSHVLFQPSYLGCP